MKIKEINEQVVEDEMEDLRGFEKVLGILDVSNGMVEGITSTICKVVTAITGWKLIRVYIPDRNLNYPI